MSDPGLPALAAPPLRGALGRWFRARRERARLVADDAADLIARFGDAAYSVARDRVRAAREGRTVDANRPDGHWTEVKLRIADLTGKEIGLDEATRRLGGPARAK